MVFDPSVVLDFSGIDFGRVASSAGLVKVVAFGDDAGTDDSVAQRDIPEPAAAGEIGDGSGSFFQAGVALGVLIECPDGNFVELGVAISSAVFALIECVAARAVEGDGGHGFEEISIASAGTDASDAVAGFEEIEGGGIFTNFDALGAGVVEKHEIKILALDLPSGGSRVVEVLEKVEGRGDFSVGGGELDRVFAGEADLGHSVNDAEAIESKPAKRHEGLADVVAGKGFFFEKQNPVPFFCE